MSDQKYEPVMGLEVHVELNTKTKMFCRCSADYFGKEPNTHTCPVCLGLPGALPFINEQAIESCSKIGLALGCTLNETTYFERKNYFYPDLAKGFQTSQLVLPVAVDGEIEVEGEGGKLTKIRINRVHQEEDTGKLSHPGGATLIDFNRSGVPLVEIVTEPDFSDTTQIKDYAKKLQQIFRYLGVSNADMERGDMRLEANISVRPVGPDSAKAPSGKQKELPPYRVELKNINSFRFMAQAVEYEIKRQFEALEKGEKLVQETRGWDEDKRQTYVQRSKEEAHDYRYFPEPDLPAIRIENLELRIKQLRESMPELPGEKIVRFTKELGVSLQNAKILVESKELANFFEEVVKEAKAANIDPQQVANYITNQKVDPKNSSAKQVIDAISSKSVGIISDEGELERLAKEVIEENPGVVESYKKGKTTVLQAFIGQIMRKTQGKADVGKVTGILTRLLA